MPAPASAAPAIGRLDVFGDSRPGVGANPSWLFATSLPYGVGERGQASVRGVATPGSTIEIEVTDGVQVVGATTTTEPATAPNPGAFEASIRVTDLGVHEAGPDPESTDPDDWGPSELTVRVTPVHGGVRGPTEQRTLTKFAGTPLDATAPVVERALWPPRHWCHFSGWGVDVAGSPSRPGSGFGLGGKPNGDCGTAAPVPDVTWTTCIEPVPGVTNPMRRTYCASPTPGGSIPTGTAQVSGSVTDEAPDARGIASEIARVHIQVFWGTAVLYDFPNVISRVGPTAEWSMPLSINDFKPNFPSGPLYRVRATITDAWGHQVVAESPGITVYPW